MIRKTAGAELCATHQNAKPSAADCVRAYDETYKGRINLSQSVKVGDPVQKSALHWSVPYDVTDAAGNKAATVWRDVIVEEVDLEDVESKMRRDFAKEKEAAIRKAVDQALAEERNNQVNARNRRANQPKCPECPKCNCTEKGGGLDEATCLSLCQAKMESCAVDEHSWIIRAMLWLEGYIPVFLVPVMLGVSGLFVVLLFVRFIISFFVEQQTFRPTYETNPEHFQNSITVYHTPNGNTNRGGESGFGANYGTHQNFGGSGGFGSNNGFNGGSGLTSPNNAYRGVNGVPPNSAPPRSSISLGDREGNSGLFTPTSGVGTRSHTASSAPRPNPVVDIYEQAPLITPNRRGDGVRRRSPFSR